MLLLRSEILPICLIRLLTPIRTILEDENVQVENETNVTVIFPDSSLPQSTRGAFSNQEEFRKFITQNQEGSWDSQLHARPSAEKLFDHKGETMAMAFPHLFPYGFSGFPDDKAVMKLSFKEGRKRHVSRDLVGVLRKYLLHRKAGFHCPTFVLIANNVIMKQSIFDSARIYCNCKKSDSTAMGEKYGGMSQAELEMAIQNSRDQSQAQFSNRTGNSFLTSIKASCKSLPHTNEASLEARKIYFSYLVKFGLPCVFLTITPDDNRNYRISLYDMEETEYKFGHTDANNFTEESLLFQFDIRKRRRTNLPGLCAEEYRRVLRVVVEHIFQWDTYNKKSRGRGLFGELLAWTCATEEQGRKTLHGHYLLFVKNWKTVLENLQKRDNSRNFIQSVKSATKFYNSICSARLFGDFDPPSGCMNQQPVFHHNCERSARRARVMRYTCVDVSSQALREMRHKQLCHEHNGHIATCPKCSHEFRVNDIVTTALNCHLGKGSHLYGFPDSRKRLDTYVYELQKNRHWTRESPYVQGVRYFSANALVNVHLPCHASRCFKKGPECYANLPDSPMDKVAITFEDNADLWTDCLGNKSKRYMFRMYPKRSIADAFMNSHNKVLTQIFLTNTNVMFGMNGQAVFYVTGYNIKAQQKEESYAYERVSATLIKTLQRQEEQAQEGPAENILCDYSKGFRRMLCGIYSHTSAHVVAAPMAHYLALEGSRFQYSHDHCYLPVHIMENMLEDKPVLMKFRSVNGRQVPYNHAMAYLHRPNEMEDMCSYEFYSRCTTMSRSQAEIEGVPIHDLQTVHPLSTVLVVVYRDYPVVPVFQWNWVGSCLGFETPLLAMEKEGPEQQNYCRRLMILFLPFRQKEDLCGASNNYLAILQSALEKGTIKAEYVEIANNMQDIHNSLSAKMPDNLLTLGTDPCDIDLEQEDPPDDGDFEAFQMNIANFMASTSTATVLREESSSFNPTFTKEIEFREKESEELGQNLKCVFHHSSDATDKEKERKNKGSCRFYTSTSTLNSLFRQQYIVFSEVEEESVPEWAEGPAQGHTEGSTVKIQPNGTWQSIVKWGTSSGLDTEQQVAFEIMVATYVLSFLTEAGRDEDVSDLTESQERCLRKFARQKEPRETALSPLRLFVTGPAGAGKCEFYIVCQM